MRCFRAVTGICRNCCSRCIPEKTSTAIVGPSSSGKTTLCFAVQRAEDLLRKVERVVFALLVGQARIRSKIFQRQGIFLCQRAGGS